jgi:hypothetical protein
MAKAKKKEDKKFHIEIVKQITLLSTSGFGLVAALAWNSVIQEFVNVYVKKVVTSGEWHTFTLYLRFNYYNSGGGYYLATFQTLRKASELNRTSFIRRRTTHIHRASISSKSTRIPCFSCRL